MIKPKEIIELSNELKKGYDPVYMTNWPELLGAFGIQLIDEPIENDTP